MRRASSILTVALAIGATWMPDARAQGSREKGKQERRILSAAEVREALQSEMPKISDCYKQHAAEQEKSTGDLKLELIVRRDGSVVVLRVVAAGVEGDKLDTCVRGLAKAWTLPRREAATHALVPFFFLKTEAKGAGPMESCWSARGCPKKRKAQRARIRGKKEAPPAKGKGAPKPAKKAPAKKDKGK